MDADAPNQAGRDTPSREVGDASSLEGRDRSASIGLGDVPREIDETTLGSWLQGFFQQQPSPAADRSSRPGTLAGRSSSSPAAPSLSSDDTAVRDLADAVDEAWTRPAGKRFDITRGPSAEPSLRPGRPPPPSLRRRVRRLLRNRITPADLVRIVAMVVLLLAGAGLIVATALRYVTHIGPTGAARAPWQVPLLLAANALIWILGLTVPSLVMIKLIADLPWFRVGLYFSVIWFLAGLALFL